MKRKNKSKQPRNWNAVSAQFRNSAGAMKEKPQKGKRVIFNELMEGIEEMKVRREEKEK